MGTGLPSMRKSPKTDPFRRKEELLLEDPVQDPLPVAETVDFHAGPSLGAVTTVSVRALSFPLTSTAVMEYR